MLFKPRNPPSFAERMRALFWPRGGLGRAWRYLAHRVVRIAASPHAVALGFAAGAFVSTTPFVGFHLLLAALIALFLGGSVVASALGTFVGNPLTYPLFWLVTYDIGDLLLGGVPLESADLALKDTDFALLLSNPGRFWASFWDVAEPVLLPMTVGSIPFGLAVAALSYGLVRTLVAAHHRRRRARIGAGATGRSNA